MLRSITKSLLDRATAFERQAQAAQPSLTSATVPAKPEAGKPNSTEALLKALAPYGYGLVDGAPPRAMPSQGYVDVQVKALPNARWGGAGNEAAAVKALLDPITTQLLGLPSKPVVSTG